MTASISTAIARPSFLQKWVDALWMRAIPLSLSFMLYLAACVSPALLMVDSQGENTIAGLSALVIGCWDCFMDNSRGTPIHSFSSVR